MHHSNCPRGIRLVAQTLLLTTVAAAATSASAQTQPIQEFNVTQYSAPAAYSPGPNRIIKGPDGNIWVTFTYTNGESSQGFIGAISPQGTVVATLPTQGSPAALTSGTSGDFFSIWFIENVNGVWSLGRVSTAGNPAAPSGCPNTTPCITLETAIPYQQYGPAGTLAPTPNAITNAASTQVVNGQLVGGDNGIYITDTSNPIIWRANPNSSGAFSWTAITIDAPASGIVFGPDKNVWFTEYAPPPEDEESAPNGSAFVAYITPPISPTTTFPLTSPFLAPTTFDAMAMGPDLSSVWFSQYQGSKIYSISTAATSGSSPTLEYSLPSGYVNDMTLGPDFAIWFTQTFSPTGAVLPPVLGRLALSNGAVAFSSQLVNSNGGTFVQPYGITVGPNNNDLWFTDASVAALGDAVIIPRLVITPTPLPNAVLGQPYSTNLTATASGGTPPPQNWAVATGYSLPAGLTLSSAGVLSGTVATSAVSSTFNVTVMDSNPSPFPQTATAQQFSITVVPLLTVTPMALPSAIAGTLYPATQLTSTGGAGSYTWSLAPGSSLPSGLTLSSAGVISGQLLPTAVSATFSVTVSDNEVPPQTSAAQPFTIAIVPVLSIVTPATLPSGAIGTSYSKQLQAQGGTGAYTWSLAPGSTLPANLTLTSGGLISGPLTGLTSSTSFTVNLSDPGPPAQAVSQTFSITTTAGAAASIAATSGGGQSTQVNTPFGSPLLATVKDVSGNLVSGASVTFTAPPAGASGTFGGGQLTAVAQTNSAGVATSPTFTANATAGGPYSVTAAVGSVAAQASFTLTNTPGPPASITPTSGSGQSAQVNHAFGAPLVATITDAAGNAISGANVTFSAPSSGASGAFAGGATTAIAPTNASGVATSPVFTANATAGPYSVSATVAGIASPASFSLTNLAGAPGTITAISGGGQMAQVDQAFVNPLVATVKDASGNVISGASVTFSAPASGASGTFAGGGVTAIIQTNSSGVATSPKFTANTTAGSYNVTATTSGVASPASFTLANTAGAPGSITAVSGSGQSSLVGVAFANPFVATVKDSSGNLISGASVTFSAPASGASGTFAGGQLTAVVQTNSSGVATSPIFTANAFAGSYNVTAAAAGVASPASFALTNTAGVTPPPTFTVTGLPSSPQPGASISSATVTSSAPFTGTLTVALSASAAGFPSGINGDAGFGTGFGSKPDSVTFPVMAGTNPINFPTPLDPGTVAGTLTATLSVQGQSAKYSSMVSIEPLAPIIEVNSVQITDVTSTGFNVELVATSTTLDLKAANFTFTAASGAQISGTSTFTADVSSLLPTWFATASNYQYGGAFSLSIPFTISGSASAIGSVSVTLTNSVGTSSAVSGTQ